MPKKSPYTYHEYRAMQWENQPHDGVNFHDETINGLFFDRVMLEPKRNIFFRDIWHCPDLVTAKSIARDILRYGDMDGLQLKNRWVWVYFISDQEKWRLPGQPEDSRETIRGK